VPPQRHTLTALIATAAIGAAFAATAAGDSETSARAARAASAHASAYAREDDGSRRGYVSVSGNGSDSAGGTSARASTRGGRGSASASARDSGVSIFDGLVRARAVSVRVSASDATGSASGRVSGLTVAGKKRGTFTGTRSFSMGGYGRVTVVQATGSGIVGLRARLSRAYSGYPAGSTVKVAYAAASARDATAPPRPKPRPKPKPKPKPEPDEPDPDPKPEKPSRSRKPGPPPKAVRRKPPQTRTLATSKGFVFPVYGKHKYTNDWGAPRATTGTHVGTDIFATAGTPIVAVCDGSLNRVGTKVISGNRLWVKCDKGDDSFFYAHLSAFATESRNGAKVKTGQVVGFVGSTGDAEQTPPHLHFEVHPGNGGPVNPYPFLRAWENRRDVPAAAWVRQNGATGSQQPGTLVVVDDFLDR
jgi:murein DD-endopeptidase MepM/ murein hydrolase activator NlpD